MSFNAISDKALDAAKTSKLTKSFWAWDDMLTMNKVGFFPYTPATQMLQGLAVSIDMLHEEGLDNVFARHHRLAEATRRTIRAWGLEILCREPKYYSPAKRYFRIGHLGDINDGWLVGVLGMTEMALSLAGIPHKKGGVQAAMDYITSAHAGGTRAAAE